MSAPVAVKAAVPQDDEEGSDAIGSRSRKPVSNRGLVKGLPIQPTVPIQSVSKWPARCVVNWAGTSGKT
jgi:hypothetical protein